MVRTATAGTIAPNHGWSGGSVAGLVRSVGAVAVLERSERSDWWHGQSGGGLVRSSFFPSHSHVATPRFFKNW